MWPWGHAAVGYLVLAILIQAHRRGLPSRDETLVVLFATQLPDIIDKPLAWSFDLLPTGRSLAHSLLTTTVLIAIVTIWAYRRDRSLLSFAFGIGYLTHLLTDLPATVFAGDFSDATFLLWPLLPLPTYSTEPTFGAYLTTVEISFWFVLQAAAAVVVSVMVFTSLRQDR